MIRMDWLLDANDPRVQAALNWSCDICKAKVKHLCTNPIRPKDPLSGRVVHYGRLVDRRL